MSLRWTDGALAELLDAVAFIARDNPHAAIRIAARIRRSAGQLDGLPFLGKTGRRPGTRELAVAGTPYTIVYSLTGEDVLILSVWHGARAWSYGQP
ncbi:type II toxin-antitoxin system RelE/ParE family toxin [Elioraea sp.]|uniref:type II toxin-antitoxin system RelE/ParE family toxin n=1 Tax=Elioraea sp. TaxID=2185103 RepID=UPI003F714B4C